MIRSTAMLMLAAVIAGQAYAQVSYPPVDTSGLESQLSNMQAAIPVPASTVPPTETVTGAAGATMTFRRGDAVQPRITRTVAFTTNSSGTATVTWEALGTTPLAFVVPNVAAGAVQVPNCFPVMGTVTSTGATIKCYMTQTLLGLGLVPFAAATAGVTGQVLAIPAS